MATHTTSSPDSPGQKEKIVILGSGWGGYALSRRLSPRLFSPLVISPRPYFLFTPLLTDAAGGSLDFSHLVEPIRDRKARVDFFQAAARGVDFREKTVLCEPAVIEGPDGLVSRAESHPEAVSRSVDVDRDLEKGGSTFRVRYDKLVIAVGAVTQTFNTPGVNENALLFKDISDGRRVKRRVQECFELAVLPTTPPDMREWLLHFAIVGAGPTGTELAASLRDFIALSLLRLYPSLQRIPRVTLYDVAPKVLSMFDERLSRYAMETMGGEGITVKTSHHVRGLRWGAPGASPPYDTDPRGCLTLRTEEEGEVGIGMCVWVTGTAMNAFVIDSLNDIECFPTASATLKDGGGFSDPGQGRWHVRKAPKTGALLVDGRLRVQLENEDGQRAVLQDVFAIGDNAMPEQDAPPATAQATYQEAKWLATRLNQGDIRQAPAFSFKSMGMLAYVGDSRALMQFPGDDGKDRKYLPRNLTGRMAWIVWNSAYLTLSMSWRNKLRVAFRWLLNNIYGRDVSRY